MSDGFPDRRRRRGPRTAEAAGRAVRHRATRHGTFEAGLYAPRGADDQTPHTRDEAYVVVKGSGRFECGSVRRAFGPGELLFVPAGETHRFESFSDDLTVWVIFYGPQGGEADG